MYIRPVFFFSLLLSGLLVAGFAGTWLRRRFPSLVSEDHLSQFTGLQASVLALLGLLLGFSFSMAVGRYDTRMNAEIAEANAIGTAYARLGSLPAAAAAKERELMRQYVSDRLEWYRAGTDWGAVSRLGTEAAELQGSMVTMAENEGGRDAMNNGLVASLTGMGDAAEVRQAAIEDPIPTMAWVLLISVSLVASLLVGMGLTRWNVLLVGILPLVVAASLTLIWDLDSPRNGFIRVRQNSMERAKASVGGGDVR